MTLITRGISWFVETRKYNPSMPSGGFMHQQTMPSYTITGSENGSTPVRQQTNILANAGTLYFRHIETNFNKTYFKI